MSIVLVYLVYCFITLANVKNIILRVFLVERSAIYVTGTEFILQNGSLNLISFDIFVMCLSNFSQLFTCAIRVFKVTLFEFWQNSKKVNGGLQF